MKKLLFGLLYGLTTTIALAMHSVSTQILIVSPEGALVTPFDKQDKKGRTALHLTAISNDYELLAVLLQGGGNVDIEDNEGKTPFQSAVFSNNFKAAHLLLKHGANVDYQNNKGTALLQAVVEAVTLHQENKNYQHVFEQIKFLVNNGANIAENSVIKTRLGSIKIHALALTAEGSDIEEYLLEQLTKKALTLCFSCKKANCTLHCKQCGLVRYCSKECQRRDWANHKPFCTLYQKLTTK